MTELEKIVQTKSQQQRLFEEGTVILRPFCYFVYVITDIRLALRVKLLSETTQSSAAATAGGG